MCVRSQQPKKEKNVEQNKRHTKQRKTAKKFFLKPTERSDRFSISLLILCKFSLYALCCYFCSLHLLKFFVFFVGFYSVFFQCFLSLLLVLFVGCFIFSSFKLFFLVVVRSLLLLVCNFRYVQYLWPVRHFKSFFSLISNLYVAVAARRSRTKSK